MRERTGLWHRWHPRGYWQFVDAYPYTTPRWARCYDCRTRGEHEPWPNAKLVTYAATWCEPEEEA